MQVENEDRWLSVDELAAYLGVKPDTVYTWIRRKGPPAHRMGRPWKMLDRAIVAIGHGFRKRAVQSVLGDRNAVLPKMSEQPTSDGDFELATRPAITEGAGS